MSFSLSIFIHCTFFFFFLLSFLSSFSLPACINVVEGPGGLIGFINEQSAIPKGSDQGLSESLKATFARHDFLSMES
jgi:hypothetical protein